MWCVTETVWNKARSTTVSSEPGQVNRKRTGRIEFETKNYACIVVFAQSVLCGTGSVIDSCGAPRQLQKTSLRQTKATKHTIISEV